VARGRGGRRLTLTDRGISSPVYGAGLLNGLRLWCQWRSPVSAILPAAGGSKLQVGGLVRFPDEVNPFPIRPNPFPGAGSSGR